MKVSRFNRRDFFRFVSDHLYHEAAIASGTIAGLGVVR